MSGFTAPRPYWKNPNEAANWRALSNWLNSQVVRTTDFTFGTGFGNYGSGYEDVTVFRTRDGLVFLEGMAQKTSASSLSLILTLPEGYRPLATQVFLTPTDLVGSGVQRIDIAANGQVSLVSATGSTGYVSLSGISYSAA